MKRAVILAALAFMALVPTPVAAAPAAPAETQCARSATTQADMAGVYRASMLYVEIFPCGGIYVEWTNGSGTHAAGYITEAHASDGVIAIWQRGDALDGQPGLIVKAAERGYVQIATVDSDLNIIQVYRLRKTA